MRTELSWKASGDGGNTQQHYASVCLRSRDCRGSKEPRPEALALLVPLEEATPEGPALPIESGAPILCPRRMTFMMGDMGLDSDNPRANCSSS
jgi:hypothetical protein